MMPSTSLSQNEPIPGVLGLQQRYARLPGSPLTAAFSGSLVVTAPLPAPSGGSVQVAVTFDIVQAPSAFCLPVMQKRPWDPPFQVGCPPVDSRLAWQLHSQYLGSRQGGGRTTLHSAADARPGRLCGTHRPIGIRSGVLRGYVARRCSPHAVQVRMTWRCALPLQFSTTVAAFVADEAAVPSMLTWQLPALGEAAKQAVDHQQERMVVLAPAPGTNGAAQQVDSSRKGLVPAHGSGC